MRCGLSRVDSAVTPADLQKFGIDWSLRLTNEGGFIVALLVGIVIANFLPGLAQWLNEAIRPELYIKIAIVILGAFLALIVIIAVPFVVQETGSVDRDELRAEVRTVRSLVTESLFVVNTGIREAARQTAVRHFDVNTVCLPAYLDLLRSLVPAGKEL